MKVLEFLRLIASEQKKKDLLAMRRQAHKRTQGIKRIQLWWRRLLLVVHARYYTLLLQWNVVHARLLGTDDTSPASAPAPSPPSKKAVRDAGRYHGIS